MKSSRKWNRWFPIAEHNINVGSVELALILVMRALVRPCFLARHLHNELQQPLNSHSRTQIIQEKGKRIMKRTSLACLFVFLFGTPCLFAQTSPQASKPSPELEKQSFFVGTWKLEGTMKPSPFSRGGEKFESMENLEWMPGGFFLLAHSYSGGKLAELTVIGYDSNDKVFTHTSFSSSGRTQLWKGVAENDSWIWTKNETVDGKPVTERLTIKKTSSDSYSFVQDMKPAKEGKWFTVAEG